MTSKIIFRLAFGAVLQVFVFSIAKSQDTLRPLSKWSTQFVLGIEEHDRRLGSLHIADKINSWNPEIFGTYTIGVEQQMRLTGGKKIAVFASGALIYSQATYKRPWEDATLPPDEWTTSDFKWVDHYEEILVAPNLSMRYQFLERWCAEAVIRTKFRIYNFARDGEKIRQNYAGRWGFQHRAVESFFGVRYSAGKSMTFLARYRSAQWLHNDLNLMNSTTHSIIDGDAPPPNYEWFNPLNLQFGISLDW